MYWQRVLMVQISVTKHIGNTIIIEPKKLNLNPYGRNLTRIRKNEKKVQNIYLSFYPLPADDQYAVL